MSALILATLDFAPSAGGIQQVCVELARALTRRAIAVHVLAPDQRGAAQFNRGEPYRISRVSARWPRELGLALAQARALREAPGALLCAQWTSALVGLAPRRLVAAHRLGILAHGKELLLPNSGLRASAPYAALLGRVLGSAGAVFAVSEFTAALARARGAHSDAVHRLHLGVDTGLFQPRRTAQVPELCDGPGPHLVSVARLVARKGIDTAIDAVARLRARWPAIRYRVIGDGPDRGRLQALIEARGVQAQVRLEGALPRDRLCRAVQGADLFVLASRATPAERDVEGFGLVLLEAQACGTPVIAARSGGMPDALREGETGLLVPPDDPEALSAAIAELLADRPRLARMGQAARAFAEDHGWDRTAAEIEAALLRGD